MSTNSSIHGASSFKQRFIAFAFAVSIASAQAADAPKSDASSREQMERRLQEAQQRLEQSAQEVADLSLSLSGGAGAVRVQRAVLGLNIDMQQGAANANDGVRIVSVSPGGAAETAGLKANDLIVSFNGQALRGDAKQTPQQQLLSALREIKAEQPVTLEYRRDGKAHKTQVVPKRPPESFANFRLPSLPEPPLPPQLNEPSGKRMLIFGKQELSGFGSAELVELSPGLGKYFGTEKGLLVVRAPQGDQFKLQDGDVILDIDGRVPNGVAHAFQILNSYRAGERLKLHLMRQQKRVEVPIEVPESSTRPAADVSFSISDDAVQS